RDDDPVLLDPRWIGNVDDLVEPAERVDHPLPPDPGRDELRFRREPRLLHLLQVAWGLINIWENWTKGRCSGERVDPPDSAESGEIVVARAQLGTVLDRERRQVRVADQVAARAEWLEEIAEDGGMETGRLDHGGDRLGEPAVDQIERLLDRQRFLVDPR